MSEPIRITMNTAGGQEQSIWAFPGQNLREVLSMAGWQPPGECSGRGTCGKCKVLVSGQVSPMDDAERSHLLAGEINRGERLACRCRIMGPLSVSLAETVSPGHDPSVPVTIGNYADQRAVCRKILVPGRDADIPRPIHRRIKQALGEIEVVLPLETLEKLSRMDRQGRPALNLTALLWDGKVRAIARQAPSAYGLALDLGSTSLFAALVDMSTGQVAAVSSQPNMQRVYGADIISRVSYCLDHDKGRDNLHQILINNINAMIEDLLKKTAAEADDIYEIVAVGNPVMLHLLLNLSVANFAKAPYQGLFVDEMILGAYSLPLRMNRGGDLVLLPQVGGFVGADTTACLLTLPQRDDSRFVLIDIGTNGEVVVGNQGRFWAASAAAGPALEGGCIRCGMRAMEGAIDWVDWNEEEGLVYRVIGSASPRGLCGSAVIALTAALLKAGWIDPYGTITDKAREQAVIRSEDGEECFLLTRPENSAAAPITFSQEDIRQVQLAKAAIRVAIDLLLEQAGMTAAEIERIYLAGAFGHFLDPAHITALGMVPEVNLNRLIPIGNAAASGAISALLAISKRQEAIDLEKRVTCLELADQSGFQPAFMKHMNFS